MRLTVKQLRRLVREELERIDEMPHLELNMPSPDGADAKFGVIDFQVEKYPISPEEKRWLMNAFHGSGVTAAGPNGGWLMFSTSEGVRVATPEDVATLPHLPDFWPQYLVNVD